MEAQVLGSESDNKTKDKGKKQKNKQNRTKNQTKHKDLLQQTAQEALKVE